MEHSLHFQSALCLMNNDIEGYKRIEKRIEAEKMEDIIAKKKLRAVGKYSTFRNKVLLRDGYKCTKCSDTNRLEVHHIKMISVYPELAFDVNNGIVLCYKCHKLEHSKGAKK